MRVHLFRFLIVVGLSWTAYIRTDGFSPEVIQGALVSLPIENPNPDTLAILKQPFKYLGKGRQCFVFESQDGKYVLKFFNQKYFQMPWYSFFSHKKEKLKREVRRRFYENSYLISYQELGDEILYLHLAPSSPLPKVRLTDKASRLFEIDLAQTPFVLQKKGFPFYPTLEAIYQKEGSQGLTREIDSFLAIVKSRIDKNIADADRNVEHNWGYLDGRIFHLDPGRLYREDLSSERSRKEEWARATDSFHKWLKMNYPEEADYFEKALQNQFEARLATTSNLPLSSKR